MAKARTKGSGKRSKAKAPPVSHLKREAFLGPTKPSAGDPMKDRRNIPHVLWYTRIDTKGKYLKYALKLTIRREPMAETNPGVPGRLFWTDHLNRVVVFGEGLSCNYGGDVMTFTSREKKEVEAFVHGCESMRSITKAKLGYSDVSGNWSMCREFMFSELSPEKSDRDDEANARVEFYDHADHMHDFEQVRPSAAGKLISAKHRDANLDLSKAVVVEDEDDNEDDNEDEWGV